MTGGRPRVLLLCGYDADSHRRLRSGLRAAFRAVEWIEIALPPRHFAWRAAGNALAFAAQVPRLHYDRLLACAPVDLASLRGLRPDLASVPTVLYLHDNEFAWPDNPREQGRLDRQFRQTLALLAADRVCVNSRFNAVTLLDGVRRMLDGFPDQVPATTVVDIEARLDVLPVPLEDALFEAPALERMSADRTPDQTSPGRAPVTAPVFATRYPDPDPDPDPDLLELIWNHRWEWDKGPDRLPELVRSLRAARVPFRLHVLGQRFRRQPPAFTVLEQLLPPGDPARGQIGRVEGTSDYRRLLRAGDFVLSTALHEFQGLAVQEAIALGCVPCVPDRLAYSEWIPAVYRATSHPRDARADAEALVERLLALRASATPAPDVSALAWSTLETRWKALLEL